MALFSGGAWASLPRDTLHVVLTKPGQSGLELSKEATAELEGAEAAAARFSHSASGEPLVNADPQATATAVVAQLRACMSELQDGGEHVTLSGQITLGYSTCNVRTSPATTSYKSIRCVPRTQVATQCPPNTSTNYRQN